ncbi:hypothetical protein MMC11_008969, partial [Xylographa trunciseda]|nr:hypothetical protein [Xylographa trunciseda]
SSFLTKLPLELRRQIYIEVLGGHHIHIHHRQNFLLHRLCSHPTSNRLFWCHCGWDIGAVPKSPRSDPETPDTQALLPRGASALRFACRQTYTESTPILYTHNEFSFNAPETLLYFSARVLPHRLHAVRSLRLQWYEGSSHGRWCVPSASAGALHDEAAWLETWRVIAALRGLRTLRVTIAEFPPCARLSVRQIGRILQPLRAVTRPQVFEVHWQWEERLEEARVRLGEVPFVFVDPNGDVFRKEGWRCGGELAEGCGD